MRFLQTLRTKLPMLLMLTEIMGCSSVSSAPYDDAYLEKRVMAANILQNAQDATLYLIDKHLNPLPSEKMYHFAIADEHHLSSIEAKTAGVSVAAALEQSGHQLLCIAPDYLMRVVANGHTYDFLIDYKCKTLDLAEDGTEIAGFPLSGSADVLNDVFHVSDDK